MKLIISGIEPQFKIYKMSEDLNNKVYIGSTFYPIKSRMSAHKHANNKVDQYFSNVGFDNVTCEIIDFANNKQEMRIKENEHIENFRKNNPDHILNKNKAFTGMNPIEYAKYHYQQNRDYYRNYFTTMIMCDVCKASFQRSSMSHHQKTKKHNKVLSDTQDQ